MADFRLLDRKVVNDILQFQEEGLFLRGLVQWVGYPNAVVHYVSQARVRGKPKYTWARMLKFTYTGITSFSVVPLRIGVFVGIITSLIAFGELTYAVIIRLFTDSTVPGWASGGP